MLGFEPLGTEPIGSHYSASGLLRCPGALRVRLRAIGVRLKLTIWRTGPRA
jgi:hypothetical protein